MKCQLYYDLFAQEYQNWLFLAACMTASVVGFVSYIIGGWFSAGRSLVSYILYMSLRGGGLLVGVASCVVGIYQTYRGYADYERLFNLHSRTQESLVDGTVTDFSSFGSRRSRIPKETFTVNGIMFAYPPDALMVMPGFNQIRATGGPIHDGAFVRVSFIEDRIVRLEVCEPPNP
jgi:hypothetical protein